MAKAKPDVVKWLSDVTEEDYSAALVYLSLVRSPASLNKIMASLRATTIEEYRATDLFRAAQLDLPKSNDRPCRKEIKKIQNDQAISPVLLLRDPPNSKVIIADGFHRICAAYRIDPDVVLHCKIV